MLRSHWQREDRIQGLVEWGELYPSPALLARVRTAAPPWRAVRRSIGGALRFSAWIRDPALSGLNTLGLHCSHENLMWLVQDSITALGSCLCPAVLHPQGDKWL